MNSIVSLCNLQPSQKSLTLNGETKAYPIYRVRLELLYYNEQNDRIATWISQYKSEHGGFQDL